MVLFEIECKVTTFGRGVGGLLVRGVFLVLFWVVFGCVIGCCEDKKITDSVKSAIRYSLSMY